MIAFKAGVRLKKINKALTFMLNVILHSHELSTRVPPVLVITSINDGRHSKNSRHYTDEAIDLRSKNFPSKNSKIRFRKRLEEDLNSFSGYSTPKFRVLLERLGNPNEHFHIQVKKGEQF